MIGLGYIQVNLVLQFVVKFHSFEGPVGLVGYV